MSKSLRLTTNVKKQHTVPRFLLDKFGFGKKGKKRKLYTIDKKDERIFQQSIFDATTRNTFYNIENHPAKASLEPILNVYETHAAPLIKKIVERQNIGWLSDEDKVKISIFIAVQRASSYGEFQKTNQFISDITEKLSAFGATPEQLAEVGEDDSSIRKNMFLELILNQEKSIIHLLDKSWILYETDMKDPFYISDNPITLHNNIDMGFYGNLGIAVKGIQIHLPISSTLTLALTCPSIEESAIEGKQKVENLLATTPNILKQLKSASQLIGIVDAYENGTPIKQSNENVRFLNSLQVKFSEQYVFCEKDHFDLVKEMLKHSDNYKSGPRMTVN